MFTIYSADVTGNPTNCAYPNKHVILDEASLKEAICRDYVCAEYRNSYRNGDNFIGSDCLPVDCDNDHSENPEDWVTPDDVRNAFRGVRFAVHYSRFHQREKKGKSARPKFHVLFPIDYVSDATQYSDMKKVVNSIFPYFDTQALDAARFFFGTAAADASIYPGEMNLTEFLNEALFDAAMPEGQHNGSVILEGSRNNTMSHFAGRVLKKLGVCDKAREAYLERAKKCEPPLSDAELETIWHSAVKFYQKISAQDGYVAPEEYNDTFGSNSLKPEDYSDLGEAKVMARECIDSLRYTSATDYIAFHGDCWHEDKQKSLGIVEDFMDIQLADAEEAVRIAEEALVAIGIDKEAVKSRSKEIAKMVPAEKLGLLYALIGADTYKKFVMKYRNYKNIVNVQNAAKPMLALDVSELDYDPELLNTPEGTYDLSKGLDGRHPHDPDDLITKITACAPGDQGMELWEDSLRLFFCGDQELIDYAQEIVGMAAIGKVYAEHMIIAYGGGANGKSTFWNTIARVLGNYSGKISAEALTMNCKRNIKPEMAELKGKRLIIASELEEGTRLNTGMVKQLCSVDPIEAEKKYKDPFHFDPSHTLVLYTNHLPKVSANDDGTWRRLIVIPFNAKITGKSDIKNYSDYLFEHVGPAIMKWIIQGAEIAIQKGFKFKEPKVVQDAINAYREDNDWLGQFIEEHCDVDPSYEEKSGELYQCYRSACMASGEYTRSTTDFYSGLEKAGFEKRRRNTGRVVLGLRLKEGQDFLE